MVFSQSQEQMNRSVGSNGTSNKNSKKAPLRPQNGKKGELLGGKSQPAPKTMVTRRRSTRERKLALLQDVDNLKKKLRHEENVHRALERAFNRPLGALPRLPPYLPQYTLELLAEVAVLEEEVVRLEEQVVDFQQGIYQEGVYTSSRRSSEDLTADELSSRTSQQRHLRSSSLSEVCLGSSRMRASPHSLPQIGSSRKPLMADSPSDSLRHCSKILSSEKYPQHDNGLASNVGLGRSNGSSPNSDKDNKHVERKFPVIDASPVKRCQLKPEPVVKTPNSAKIKYRILDQARESSSGSSDDRLLEIGNEANKLSEDILNCLIRIFIRLSSSKGKSMDLEQVFSENNAESDFRAPCCPFPGPRKTEIGSYKFLHSIEAHSLDFNRTSNASFLIRRLKLLLSKLALIKLDGLNHQEKLAFWINVYNSCNMNAFLEHGIPEGPDMMIMHMKKATIKVGGHSLNALMIEHLILRLPYHLKFTCSKSMKHDESKICRMLGLEWSEPLVTFALSCGSWSSPAVRVYTGTHIEAELEAAKRDYIQASVSVSAASKIIIPKLLDWYLLDFAKDLDGLLDWVCLQLADKARGEAVRCLEQKGRELASKLVEVMPYNFSFRYLVCL